MRLAAGEVPEVLRRGHDARPLRDRLRGRGHLPPTHLKDFYIDGFNTVERNAILKEKYPGKFILNGRFDPREAEEGLKAFEDSIKRCDLKGVKLYTAEWMGNSKRWSLKDDWAKRYLENSEELGVTNIHVHKGPTIWPFNRDAFDVADVDDAATEFPNLTSSSSTWDFLGWRTSAGWRFKRPTSTPGSR